MHVTFIGYSWNNQRIFLYSIFLEHYLGIFLGIPQGTFSKYSGNISWECSTNIPQTIFPEYYLGIFHGISQGTFSEYSGNVSWNVLRIFHEHIFARWAWLTIPTQYSETCQIYETWKLILVNPCSLGCAFMPLQLFLNYFLHEIPEGVCEIAPEENCLPGNCPRTIATWMIMPWIIAPWIIAPEDNCPRGKLPQIIVPRTIALRRIVPDECCPLGNYPLDDCPQIIAPGKLL